MKPGKFFAAGQELLIDKRLGKGGEGEVFSIRNMPGFAVKVYFPAFVAEREFKIKAMVEQSLADTAKMVAFPQQVVVDERGSFAGFVMRIVEKHKEIHELQTPGSRQQHFPKADYRFITRAALNVARIFAGVHSIGNVVIGDINERGVLVATDAQVALIDADSFQVKLKGQTYPCTVGVPEYTPPELQGRSLRSIERTVDHDAFGLAICLFRLLCMDRHPFSGRFKGQGDMPLEKAIEEFRFAYSARDTGMMPPPGSIRMDDFPREVSLLFEDAFSRDRLGKRPSAKTWIEALTHLEKSLRPCNVNKLHWFSSAAKDCPWCRMEREHGRSLFFDVDLASFTVGGDRINPASGYVLDLAALLSSINSVAIPQDISIPIPQVSIQPKPSKAAEEARSNKGLVPLIRLAGAGAIGGAIYGFASGLPGLLAIAIAAVGGWIATRQPSHTGALVAEYRKRATILVAHVEKLQRQAPLDKVLAKKAEALSAIDEFKALSSQFGGIRSTYDKQRRKNQLEQYLAQFRIRGSGIKKLRSSDVAQLASFGFSTALDAHLRDVQTVHGIGPVKAGSIEAWVRALETKFQFKVAYTQQDQNNIQKLQSEIIRKQQGIEERIKKLVIELRQEALVFERWRSTTDPDLVRFATHLAEAASDLRYVGEAIPPMPSVAPMPVSRITPARAHTPASASTVSRFAATPVNPGQAPTCPNCASRMVKRMASRSRNSRHPFWGCSRYPSCKGTRPI